MNGLLDGDLSEAARALTAQCVLRAARNPALFRTALAGRRELAEFFDRELGWTVEIQEVAGLIRLHKRRDDVPGDRGPRLVRKNDRGEPARAEVLVMVALVCEQLWRRPRLSLRELLQSVAQVCAAESESGRLPAFRMVAADGVSKREAQAARQTIVDALKLLEADGEITVDAELEQAVTDEEADLYIIADRDSLATKFAALSPTLLDLSARPADQHVLALTARSLADADPEARAERRAGVEGRRLTAMRRIVDDPATDPMDDPDAVGYLQSLTGRERALNVAASLGLGVTVRRDWWEVTDPAAAAGGTEFPYGRRTERQAALALLAELAGPDRPPGDLALAEITALFTAVRDQLPRWAAAYAGRLQALGRAAAAELIAMGLLEPTGQADRWRPTPGIHLWQVSVRHGETATAPPARPPGAASTEQTLFCDPQNPAEHHLAEQDPS